MSLLSNFVSALVASTTAFTGSVADIPMSDPIPVVQNYSQEAVDRASEVAQTSSFVAGVTVIDRANKNSMKFNGQLSHTEFPLQSLGRLPILMSAILQDDDVAKGDVTEIVSMMQGYSGSATDAMWEKYGGRSIITDLSAKYNLEEVTVGSSWHDTTMSSIDLARMYRRFLDDDDVSTQEKQWMISMMRGTSLSVSGQDFSWGLPSAQPDNNESSSNQDDESTLAWAQGWSDASGQGSTARSTTGILGKDMRYIVIIHGQFPSETTNDVADQTITEMSQIIVDSLSENVSQEKKDNDARAEKFYNDQVEEFGEFVGEKSTQTSTPSRTTSRSTSTTTTSSSSTKDKKSSKDSTTEKGGSKTSSSTASKPKSDEDDTTSSSTTTSS